MPLEIEALNKNVKHFIGLFVSRCCCCNLLLLLLLLLFNMRELKWQTLSAIRALFVNLIECLRSSGSECKQINKIIYHNWDADLEEAEPRLRLKAESGLWSCPALILPRTVLCAAFRSGINWFVAAPSSDAFSTRIYELCPLWLSRSQDNKLIKSAAWTAFK